MNKIAFFLITLFLLLGIKVKLFSQMPKLDRIQSTTYPGLIFWIDKETFDSYWKAYDEYGKLWNGKPNLSTILKNMDNCFNEAVAYYEKKENKNKLPTCLDNCLKKLLDQLKKSGRTILNCTWHKDEHVPWPFVYKQRFDLVEAEANGMSTKKEDIYLINVWKKTYDYNKEPVMTSSILLHELIHCVKKHYPDCFKELGRPEEEGTTEDGTVMLYGKDNCCTGYKDRFGWDTKCTYENVCKCECAPKNFD